MVQLVFARVEVSVEFGEVVEVVPRPSSSAFLPDLVEVVNAESACRDSDTRPQSCDLCGSVYYRFSARTEKGRPTGDSPWSN